jgi:prepilin-type N-terminal cleavage/methylation domain-containing protein
MSLQQIKNLKDQKGFTIVELLIVIVVIGILAAIVIVAFNGVQSRANTTAAKAAANTVMKKAEQYNALASAYPQTLANFDAYAESKMSGSGVGLVATPVAATGKTTVTYQACTAGAGSPGGRIQFWDFSSNAVSSAADTLYVGNASATVACTTWATAPTLTAGN